MLFACEIQVFNLLYSIHEFISIVQYLIQFMYSSL